MSTFKFVKNIRSYNPQCAFVARVSKVLKNENELFYELNKQLCLPDYFGFNWNALSDCLTDFHWLEQEGVVLIHNHTPLLNEFSMKIYLEVLIYAIQDWKEDDKHYFEVVFPLEAEDEINFYLKL